MGVVDRRADGARPDRARAARRAADPLDAVDAAARAGDEGDPAEVQGRPAEAQRGADEVLQGEQHQSGRLVPAAGAAVPDLHRALLHAPSRVASHHRLVAPHRPEHLGKGDGPLVGLPAARDLRRLAGRLDLLHGSHDGQDAAADHDGPPAGVPDRGRPLPDGADHLLDDDQPLDGRPGPDHAAPGAEDAGRRRPRAGERPTQELPHAGREPEPEPEPEPTPEPAATPAPAAASTPPRRVRRKKKGGARR